MNLDGRRRQRDRTGYGSDGSGKQHISYGRNQSKERQLDGQPGQRAAPRPEADVGDHF